MRVSKLRLHANRSPYPHHVHRTPLRPIQADRCTYLQGLSTDIQLLNTEQRDKLLSSPLACLIPPKTALGPEQIRQQAILSSLVDANAELLCQQHNLDAKALVLREPRLFCTGLSQFQEFCIASGMSIFTVYTVWAFIEPMVAGG